ncbi:MAG TPA: maleylacetate reductase [Gemmatimonadaceae bacterium]
MTLELSPPRFTYDLRASRVAFGPGALRDLGTELAVLGARRVFVVSTKSRLAEVPPMNELLGERFAGVFDEAVEHVPAATVVAAQSALHQADADFCLAIGGGSAIGLGKILARDAGKLLAAVPTTYSGSEMTAVWGMTDVHGKRTGRDPRVAPRIVIYDPDLTLSLSPALSGASGMNAMAHAVEAMYAANASPMALALAEESARLLAASLPRVFANPHDHDARSTALSGAHLAGRALDLAAMGLHHRICHVLGGLFGLPHARTHAAVLPYVLAYNAPAARSAMLRLARSLEAYDSVTAIMHLCRTLGVARPLSELGLRKDDIDRAADEVTASPYANPRPATKEDVRGILLAAFYGDSLT